MTPADVARARVEVAAQSREAARLAHSVAKDVQLRQPNGTEARRVADAWSRHALARLIQAVDDHEEALRLSAQAERAETEAAGPRLVQALS